MTTKTIAASLSRRLLALLYDALLLLGVLFAVSACAVAINNGEAVTHPLYYLCLVLTAFVFFGWFWTHGGQTLGMRTWKIKIITNNSDSLGNNDSLSWKQAAVHFTAAALALLSATIGLIWLITHREQLVWHDTMSVLRFAAAALALLPAIMGLLWVRIDNEQLAWHDKLSKTRLISLKAMNKAELNH